MQFIGQNLEKVEVIVSVDIVGLLKVDVHLIEPLSMKRGDTARRYDMFLVGNVHPVNSVSVFLIINSRQ